MKIKKIRLLGDLPIGKDSKKIKVLISPWEICENMQRLANGFRKKGVFATSVNYKSEDAREYMNDINMQLEKCSSKAIRIYKRLTFFAFALANYDVFHFFYGRTLLPRFMDLPFLKKLGKKIFMHFRGADCLNYALFDYWRSQAVGGDMLKPPVSLTEQQKDIKTLDKYCDEFFISTPTLAQALPHSVLIPQVVELEKFPYVGVERKKSSDELLIIHPTSSQWKFGSEFITKAIEDLGKKNYNLNLIIVENVPHNKVKEIYAKADIGIDSMLQGWYGNISIELMALGKPVLCFIRDEFKDLKPDLPIYNAHPRELANRLEELIKNYELRLQLGEHGREYVEKNHETSVIVDKLLDLYQTH